jgi:hypothetical protein
LNRHYKTCKESNEVVSISTSHRLSKINNGEQWRAPDLQKHVCYSSRWSLEMKFVFQNCFNGTLVLNPRSGRDSCLVSRLSDSESCPDRQLELGGRSGRYRQANNMDTTSDSDRRQPEPSAGRRHQRPTAFFFGTRSFISVKLRKFLCRVCRRSKGQHT